MGIHKPFIEEVNRDGVILSRLMPDKGLFTSLKKIAKDHGVEGSHPFSYRKL